MIDQIVEGFGLNVGVKALYPTDIGLDSIWSEDDQSMRDQQSRTGSPIRSWDSGNTIKFTVAATPVDSRWGMDFSHDGFDVDEALSSITHLETSHFKPDSSEDVDFDAYSLDQGSEGSPMVHSCSVAEHAGSNTMIKTSDRKMTMKRSSCEVGVETLTHSNCTDVLFAETNDCSADRFEKQLEIRRLEIFLKDRGTDNSIAHGRDTSQFNNAIDELSDDDIEIICSTDNINHEKKVEPVSDLYTYNNSNSKESCNNNNNNSNNNSKSVVLQNIVQVSSGCCLDFSTKSEPIQG